MMHIIEMRVPGAQGMALFQLRGLLNAETFEQLEHSAQRWIDQGTQCLVIDLAEVSYMSSAGIRALNHIFHAMRTDAPEDSDRAIKDGMRFLRATQRADGSWVDVEMENARTGNTGLATLALLTAGEPVDSPTIQKALETRTGWGGA